MENVREPPQTLEQFKALTWGEKRRLKSDFPSIYWKFIEQIKNRKED